LGVEGKGSNLTTELPRNEGYIDAGAGRVWYESVGEGPAIVLLHGGPGSPSDYLIPLMEIAADGYQVVRYDQLGSRRSDKPDDTSLWVVPRFVDEVETVRSTLGLGPVRLIGQSWGAFLALEYALHHRKHLHSLVLYSGAASTAECVAGMNALRDKLPPASLAILEMHEATESWDHPAYVAVVAELYRRHLCRVDPFPALLQASMDNMAKPVYESMWGPNEFTCTGNLMDWDRSDRLGEITVPTLILCGRHDEVVPACSETMHAGIPGSELVIFEESSHLAHFEEPERFFQTVRAFLRRTGKVPAVNP
jgi:proline-specific peptidase